LAAIRMELATMEHVRELAANIRKADEEEIKASGDYTTLAALEDSLHMSRGECWAVFFDDKLALIWGTVPIGHVTKTAIPWMITTEVVNKHPKTFVKLSRNVIIWLRRRYSLLTAMVDVRYYAALRWAERMGFHVGPPEVISSGYKFCRITMGGL